MAISITREKCSICPSKEYLIFINCQTEMTIINLSQALKRKMSQKYLFPRLYSLRTSRVCFVYCHSLRFRSLCTPKIVHVIFFQPGTLCYTSSAQTLLLLRYHFHLWVSFLTLFIKMKFNNAEAIPRIAVLKEASVNIISYLGIQGPDF